MTIEIGTILHAHTTIPSSSSDHTVPNLITEGQTYEVHPSPVGALGVTDEPHFFSVVDDKGYTRVFSTERSHPFYYRNWFDALASKEEIEQIKDLLNSN